VIRLRIRPAPTADEAAAIEAAIGIVVARKTAGAKRLRYGDVVGSIAANPTERPGEPARFASWRAVARLESFEPRV
jgi:hypothetical protein